MDVEPLEEFPMAMEDQLVVSEIALSDCKERIAALEKAVLRKDEEIAKLEGELYTARYNRDVYYRMNPLPMDPHDLEKHIESESGKPSRDGVNLPPPKKIVLPPLPVIWQTAHPDHDVWFADVDKCRDWVQRNVCWLPKQHCAEIYVPKGVTDHDLLHLLLRLYVCERARHEEYDRRFDQIRRSFFFFNQALSHAAAIDFTTTK